MSRSRKKPAASWGEDSPLPSALPRFVLPAVAFRRAEQGSPHPAAQTPLRFFMSVFSVSLSLRYFGLHITQALVFSPDTLADIPEGTNAIVLAPVRAITRGLPPMPARKLTPC